MRIFLSFLLAAAATCTMHATQTTTQPSERNTYFRTNTSAKKAEAKTTAQPAMERAYIDYTGARLAPNSPDQFKNVGTCKTMDEVRAQFGYPTRGVAVHKEEIRWFYNDGYITFSRTGGIIFPLAGESTGTSVASSTSKDELASLEKELTNLATKDSKELPVIPKDGGELPVIPNVEPSGVSIPKQENAQPVVSPKVDK